MFCEAMMVSFNTLYRASSCSIPPFTNLSIWVLNSFNWCAIAALITIIDAAQLADEPAARNSKRFPVKAKGEVRLRSVLSCNMAGMRPIPNCNAFFSSGVSSASFRRATTSSNIWERWRPRKIDRIAGGASFAPRRWLFPALTIEARSKSWFL